MEVRRPAVDEALEVQVYAALARAGLTLAVAESCTGGLVGDLVTNVSGSSAYFLGGVIAYNDRLKMDMLGVPPEVIREHGAVSAECARLMASGVRARTGADLALSVTGIAGPGGATPTKPVGTVYIALAGEAVEQVEHHIWDGDRLLNKRESAETALRLLLEHLNSGSR
jgi:PncC family amidohydrolase